MFITIDTLEKFEACEHGKKWFERHFPNGAELIDVINHRTVTPEILHWGYTNLATTAEEKAAYLAKINVYCDNIESIYESHNIKNSVWVSRSSEVENSSFVFSSKSITDCEDILSSEEVSNSRNIYSSEFVYDSAKVFDSKNINNSTNIVNSDYVVNSRSVMNAATVTNSAFVNGWLPGETKQIRDCRFIMACSNLKHSLFCCNIHDGEYMMFNKQIDASDYEIIIKQLDRILADYCSELVVDNEWPSHRIVLDSPRLQRNIIKQYDHLPKPFWRWVKTLPGYDATVLYGITYNPNLL